MNLPTIEGFYFWLVVNKKDTEVKLFKFALRRLAKENPDADPREILLEKLAERIYEYEQGIKEAGKSRPIKKYELRDSSEFHNERAEKFRRLRESKQVEPAESEASEGTSRHYVPRLGGKSIFINLDVGGVPEPDRPVAGGTVEPSKSEQGE